MFGVIRKEVIMIMVMIFYFGSFGWDVMHGSNTRREQRQRNTQRELDRERERRRNFENYSYSWGVVWITASERKVVSASERERKSKQRENNQLAKKNKPP